MVDATQRVPGVLPGFCLLPQHNPHLLSLQLLLIHIPYMNSPPLDRLTEYAIEKIPPSTLFAMSAMRGPRGASLPSHDAFTLLMNPPLQPGVLEIPGNIRSDVEITFMLRGCSSSARLYTKGGLEGRSAACFASCGMLAIRAALPPGMLLQLHFFRCPFLHDAKLSRTLHRGATASIPVSSRDVYESKWWLSAHPFALYVLFPLLLSLLSLSEVRYPHPHLAE